MSPILFIGILMVLDLFYLKHRLLVNIQPRQMHALFNLTEYTNELVPHVSTGQAVDHVNQSVTQDVKHQSILPNKEVFTKEKTLQQPTNVLRSQSPANSDEDYETLSRKVLNNLEIMQKSEKVVVYSPEGGAGFGNFAGGLVTLFTIAVCKGAAFKMYRSPYSKFLYSYVPNVIVSKRSAMEIPGVVNIDPISYWDWRKNTGNHTFQHDSIITSSIFDVIDQIIPKHDGFAKFRELGISFAGTKTEKIRKIRNTIYRLFFNPIESLCNSINTFSASLESENRVGFQVRMGGDWAFTQEKKVFLNESDISGFFLQLEKVKTAIRNQKKAEPQLSLFVSTDSYLALEVIKKELGEIVRAAPDIQRGHSSLNQLSRSKASPTNVLKGTFFDLFVLKDCNILISTDYSSFGNLAFEMGLENPYLFEPKGMMGKCTVYNRPVKTRVQYHISKQKK